jgi:hypothetical protein
MNDAECLLNSSWVDEEGSYFIGSLENKSFKNHSVNNAHEATELANKLSNQGIDVYFAMGIFANHSSRQASNAVGASAFWLDIDCGQEKFDKGAGYKTKSDANKALKKFCDDAGMPYPSHLVDSGNGLHAHWILDRSIARTAWQATARKFKSLTVKHGLIADPTRTADIASVLRVPNTNNYKDQKNPKLVKLKYANPNISADAFVAAINASSENVSTDLTKLFKLENLGVASAKGNEPYPFTNENAIELLSAAHSAYPNIQDEGEFAELGFICANLITHDGWPETEVRRIFDEVCLSAPNAKTENNDTKWESFKTQSLSYTGEPRRVLSLFRDARDNGWQPKTKVTDALAAVQDKFGLISLGGKVGIIDKQDLEATNIDGSAARLVIMSRMDGGLLVQRHLSSEFPQVDSKATLSTFIHSKGTILYNGVEFNPRSTTPNVLNLWVGITINPRLGKWDSIYVLLHDVICGGRDSEYQYLIKFIAHALLRPWEKPGVMIILLGGQGVGKGSLAKLLQKIWSATFLQVNRIKQIVGDFNGSLERAYIVFLDEALFAGDRSSCDALKSLVTEPTISINEKHQPARQITSYHRFFSATNADHFKATDRDDRRDFVLRVSEHRKGDYAFWNALNAEIENSGATAFTHDLLSIDLTGFNVRAKPNTRELTQQKLQSLEKFPRWWFDCLSQGKVYDCNSEWPMFISSASLLRLFLEAENKTRSYKQFIDRDVVAFMTKMCPSAKREQGMEGSHRRRGYIMPVVNIARKDFEKYIGDIVEWEDL